jgi:hypothetical protein
MPDDANVFGGAGNRDVATTSNRRGVHRIRSNCERRF